MRFLSRHAGEVDRSFGERRVERTDVKFTSVGFRRSRSVVGDGFSTVD